MSSSESFLNAIKTTESVEVFGEGSTPDVFLDSGVKLPLFYASDSRTVIFQEYKAKKKENFRMVCLIPSLLVFYFAAGTRFRLAQYGQDGPLFLCSFILYLMETTVFTTFFVAHVIIVETVKLQLQSKIDHVRILLQNRRLHWSYCSCSEWHVPTCKSACWSVR